MHQWGPLHAEVDDDSPHSTDETEKAAQQSLIHSSERQWTALPLKSCQKLVSKRLLTALVSVIVLWVALGLLLRHSTHSQSSRYRSKVNSILFEEIFNGTYVPKDSKLSWIDGSSDGFFTYQAPDRSVYIQNTEDAAPRVVFKHGDPRYSDGRDMFWSTYVFSPNMTHVLLKTDQVKTWRHSQKAHYFIYDLVRKTTWPLVNLPDEPQASYAAWAPSGDRLAFVSDNDLYFTTLDATIVTRITHDGSSTVSNGVPDWVYEEEIYEKDHTMWWSPNGQSIAFLKFDDGDVHQFTVPKYFQQRQTEALQYPENLRFRYPKPGTPNPVVTAHVYKIGDSEGSETILSIPEDFSDVDRLVLEVAWMGNNKLMVKTSNRISNSHKYTLYDTESRIGRVVRRIPENDNGTSDGWFDASQRMRYIGATTGNELSSSYIDVVYHDDNRHLALFTPLDNAKGELLTSGKWEVVGGVAGFDDKTQTVYFLTTEASPSERHLSSVTLKDGKVQHLTAQSNPAWYDASFSPGGAHYFLSYQGPDVPYEDIVDARTAKTAIKFENNSALRELVARKRVPVTTFGTIQVGGFDLPYSEIMPGNADLSGATKYPVIFKVYNGPNSQIVQKRFKIHWDALLASEENIITVVVDGRGTGYKGRHFRNLVYRQLGRLEAEDQIAAAKLWAMKPYVDRSRIGIWGWSYGGYMVNKVIEADSAVFSLGIAVAPVTDWRFYDSVYTERYMGLPSDNSDGYSESAVERMEGFRKIPYMLIHGSGDDNVHFQHSASLIDKFTSAQIHRYRFRLFIDSDHSISYRGATAEVYYAMRDFIRDTWTSAGHNAA